MGPSSWGSTVSWLGLWIFLKLLCVCAEGSLWLSSGFFLTVLPGDVRDGGDCGCSTGDGLVPVRRAPAAWPSSRLWNWPLRPPGWGPFSHHGMIGVRASAPTGSYLGDLLIFGPP